MSTRVSKSDRQLRILVFGPQGSGKGTQGEILAKRFDLPVFNMGEILRHEIAQGTKLGRTIKKTITRGGYASNDMVNSTLEPYLKKIISGRGYVIDGYPRKIGQLEFLDRLLPPTLAINITLPDFEAVKRLANRRVCAQGHVYHLIAKPPRRPGRCDIDGLPLKQRADDTPAGIRSRLRLHARQTGPVIKRLRQRGILLTVDGRPSIAKVSQALAVALKRYFR